MAEEFGENPETILAEIEHDPPTPVGRFILKLMRFATPEVRRGRPRHGSTPKTRERDHVIYRTVESLRDDGKALPQAFAIAPAVLANRGIFSLGRDKRKMHHRTVERAYHRGLAAQIADWFEPPQD